MFIHITVEVAMKKNITFTLVFVLVSFFLSGFTGPGLPGQDQPGQAPVTEYKLIIKQIDDEWRVVHEGDESKSDVVVNRGDRIRWIPQGSDVSFQFMEENLVGHNRRTVKDGRPLVLAIGDEARKGIHPYSVFIHKDLTYAVGQSPPRIIVE